MPAVTVNCQSIESILGEAVWQSGTSCKLHDAIALYHTLFRTQQDIKAMYNGHGI